MLFIFSFASVYTYIFILFVKDLKHFLEVILFDKGDIEIE